MSTSKHFVEVGRVALIHYGPDAGKVAAIVDVIDQNRALIDGPSTGVRRQAIQFRRLRLTRFRIRIPNGTSSKTVKLAWDKNEITKKFEETAQHKRLVQNKRREELTDFERFKLYKTRQRINKLVQAKFERLRAKAIRDEKAKNKK